MSSTPNSLPSSDLPQQEVATVSRDLSLPFRRDFNTPWEVPSHPLTFKNPHNTRTQAIFFFTNDASNVCLNDIDVETQSFSSVDETPLRQMYGQKIADAVLWLLLAIKSWVIRH